jgi:hypothetical protein
MRKKILISILFVFFVAGSFYLGSIFGTYSHSKLQESTYPFSLREVLVKNMPTCSDYARISQTAERMEFKKLMISNKESVLMILSAGKSGGNAKFLVSIINSKHEQYFDEIYPDCPL